MNVKVYSTTSCMWCTKVKEYLTEKGIAFESIDVTTNREIAKELVKKTGQMAVPIVEIDGDYIVGFNKEQIDAKLGIK